MQTLPKYIDELLDIFIADIKHTIKECFAGIDTNKKMSERKVKSINDQSKPPRPSPGKPQGSTASQQFSKKFWTALENLFDEEIFNCWKQINFLTKCLKKVNYQPNASSRYESVDIEKNFHDRLNELLRTSFTDCPPHIKQCLVQDLPKLLRLTKQLNSKCENRLSFGWVLFCGFHFPAQSARNHFQLVSSFFIILIDSMLHLLCSGDGLFTSLEAGYLEQCANNLKVALIAADTPNQVKCSAFKFSFRFQVEARSNETKTLNIFRIQLTLFCRRLKRNYEMCRPIIDYVQWWRQYLSRAIVSFGVKSNRISKLAVMHSKY